MIPHAQSTPPAADPAAAAKDASLPGPPQIPLIGLFGTGRSGTTWLGTILDSHPAVAYRFEPFHRLQSSVPAIRAARDALEKSPLASSDLLRVYEALLPANPVMSRPPFFTKQHALNQGRALMWPMTKRVPLMHSLYSRIYSPPHGTTVAFKEVSLELAMTRLLERTRVPVVYIVRHPCAVAASVGEGQEKGVMQSGRFAVLRKLLAEHDPALVERIGDRIDGMSASEKNALLWRLDVETGMRAVKNSSRAMLLVYEDLCRNPLARAKDIFRLVGIPFHSATEEFIEMSTRPNAARRFKTSEYLLGEYFSVFKDPQESMNKWKKKLPAEEQQKIVAVVEDSFAYQELLKLGHWA